MARRIFLFILVIAFGTTGLIYAKNLKMPRYPVTGGWINHPAYQTDFENKVSQLELLKDISQPRGITWAEAKQFFDFSKALPQVTQEELSYEIGVLSKRKVITKHLPKVFEGVYNRQFMAEGWLRSFGDIMAHFKSLRGDAQKTMESLLSIEKGNPEIWNELKEVLPAIVQNDFLYSEHWTPWKDESASGKNNDGMFFLPYWQMRKNPSRGQEWNEHLGDHKVFQGGVFMYATLADIKRVERDYREYKDQVGMGYLMVAPLKNSYTLGVDEKGDEFIGIEIYLCQDLPWPYDATRYTMRLLDYYNSQGHYISDYYSLNREDLNWMAGRDTFFEVKTASGEFVGFLIATELDYDIKSLPERDQDRVISIKGAWGNIKVLSEGYGRVSKVSSGPGKLEK